MQIAGLQKVTLIDYPGKVACVVFTHGCNFRCDFCHNAELVVSKCNKSQIVQPEEFFQFLDTRKNKIDGVVITGGEPLLNPQIFEFIMDIKSKGFLVKLDTNGAFPEALETLLDDNVLDYVAMDVKTGFEEYHKLTNFKDVEKIQRSISLIQEKAPDYEFRTTVVKYLHSDDDVMNIARIVDGSKRFVLQNFVAGNTISKDLSSHNEFSKYEMERFAEMLKNHVQEVIIRNSY